MSSSEEKFTSMEEGSLIVIESPVYPQVMYGAEEVDRDDPDLHDILQTIGGYLTVFSTNIKLMQDTALDKLQLNLSSSEALAGLSIGDVMRGEEDEEMHDEE